MQRLAGHSNISFMLKRSKSTLSWVAQRNFKLPAILDD
ncbi:hypothetical protein K035_1546 [Acinetobacter baumannii 42057_4]|nr:hypothetical protein J521_2312 [Acinetobacter baumannii 1035119]EXF18543.1 hypothetical protein J601_2954 [Acinetobacter baumannii 831240]EXH12771.1 hypothetical protein J641_1170 [Acinetobacter baumannii 1188188]EYT39810.1 hypothetical protein J497_00983 [Acinetobacter baumannii 1121032]EZI42299.1 hypothetical protein K037_3624 [Acinetobacter baumannii 42057_6]KCW21102.1 hypothetical protein K035_1546 [Acinetobacter baumannii 42057_4]KCX05720.1 hypothetical protein J990_3515 [Acinetobacte